jgi:hypothetical protein
LRVDAAGVGHEAFELLVDEQVAHDPHGELGSSYRTVGAWPFRLLLDVPDVEQTAEVGLELLFGRALGGADVAPCSRLDRFIDLRRASHPGG